jgi:hypothetical protein
MVNGKVVYEADVFQTTYRVVNTILSFSSDPSLFQTTYTVVNKSNGDHAAAENIQTTCRVVKSVIAA